MRCRTSGRLGCRPRKSSVSETDPNPICVTCQVAEILGVLADAMQESNRLYGLGALDLGL